MKLTQLAAGFWFVVFAAAAFNLATGGSSGELLGKLCEAAAACGVSLSVCGSLDKHAGRS